MYIFMWLFTYIRAFTRIHRRLVIRGHQIWVTSRFVSGVLSQPFGHVYTSCECGRGCIPNVTRDNFEYSHTPTPAENSVWCCASLDERVIIHFIITACSATENQAALSQGCDSSVTRANGRYAYPILSLWYIRNVWRLLRFLLFFLSLPVDIKLLVFREIVFRTLWCD